MGASLLAPWGRALSLLDQPVPPDVWPAVVNCPLCQREQLTLYQDRILQQAWCCCHGCHFAGDMVDLLARAWRVDPMTAIHQLSQRCPELSFDLADQQRWIETQAVRLRFEEFWRRAKRSWEQEADPELLRLQQRLGMRDSATDVVTRQRWKGLVGTASFAEVTAAFLPNQHRSRAYKVLPGKGWKRVLVFPCCDLPGRQSALLIIGRQGAPEDCIWRPLPLWQHAPRGEVGLLFHQTLGQAMPGGQDVAVLLDDPRLAIRLQGNHLRESNRPLPLACAYEGPGKPPLQTKEIWQGLPPRTYLCAGQQATPLLWSLAAAGDLDVSWQPSISYTTNKWLRGRLQEHEPWSVNLERLLLAQPPEEARKLWRDLQLPPQQQEHFLGRCHPDLRQRLELILLRSSVERVATINGTAVVEAGDTWRVRKSDEIICGALLRIDKVFYREQTADCYYQGRLIYQGRELPFAIRQSELEEDPQLWIRKQILQAGWGLVLYNARWRAHLLPLALQFHPPEVQPYLTRFGWSSDRGAFVLPQFEIGLGGRCEPVQHAVLDPLSPGHGLSPPAELIDEDLQTLSTDMPLISLVWAILAAIGANVVAPALHHPVVGIALVGRAATTVGLGVARSAGCAAWAHKRGAELPPDIEQQLAEAVQLHDWPLGLELYLGALGSWGTNNWSQVSNWLGDEQPKNCLLGVHELLFRLLQIQGGWCGITCPDRHTLLPRVQAATRAVFVSWLWDLCHRQLQLPSSPTLLSSVLQDLAQWWGRQGGRAELVLRGETYLVPEQQADVSEAAGQLFAQLYEEGYLQGTRADFAPESAAVNFVPAGEYPAGVFVPRETVLRVLQQLGLPSLDVLTVSRALQRAGHLLSDATLQGRTGWLVSETWWTKQLQQYRRDSSQRLLLWTG